MTLYQNTRERPLLILTLIGRKHNACGETRVPLLQRSFLNNLDQIMIYILKSKYNFLLMVSTLSFAASEERRQSSL